MIIISNKRCILTLFFLYFESDSDSFLPKKGFPRSFRFLTVFIGSFRSFDTGLYQYYAQP